MNRFPAISIITPLYNGERFLPETLASVRAQVFTDWEHILVDDGSTDRSGEMAQVAARADARLRALAACGGNGGVARARNRGLAAASASSRYVIFLDQDDVWTPDALERLFRHLEAHPEACAAFGTARRIDAHGNALPEETLPAVNFVVRQGRVVPSADTRRTFAHLIPMNPIPTPGLCLMRAEAVRAAGGLDPATAPCDDWDLYLRLSLSPDGKGYLDALGGAPLLGWRLHGGNASHDQQTLRRQRRRVYEKFLDRAAPGGAAVAAMARAAMPFGMHDFDAALCRTWGTRALGAGRPAEAARYGLRALRHALAGARLRAQAATG